MKYPFLETKRLILRQFLPLEAGVVRDLAGAYEISHDCQNIPHPYHISLAEMWIACHAQWHKEGEQTVFAITRRTDGWIIGAIGLVYDRPHHKAELGYWIGVPFWSCGYATEAIAGVLLYAFEWQMMQKVSARCFRNNLASARVLEKNGMQREGLLRRDLYREGVYEDVIVSSILCDEWRARPSIRQCIIGER
jgi:[ribosomal protein S5]-alanine N-acetyltransferase